MKGFIKNEGERPTYSFKRSTPPGNTISLDEVYIVVGKQSGEKKGLKFVKWLKENKLVNSFWVIYREEEVLYFPEDADSSNENFPKAKGAGVNMKRTSEYLEEANIKVIKLIETPIEQARPMIDKCNDRGILRKALAVSKMQSRKEAHQRHLIKRLSQVY